MTKISNQYSLTNILTADLANSRLGINNVSPAYSLDLTGTARVTTSAYFATASGSVGIGNTNGTVGALNVTGRIALTSSLFFSSNLTSEDRWEINVATPANDLYFSRSGVGERMRITSAGNVGIGTSTPSARLHTEVAVESPATSAVALLAKTSNGANDIFRWFDGATQLGVFKNNGNVGIGTSSPSQKLHISDSTAVYCRIVNTTGADVYLGSESSQGVLSVSNNMNLDIRTNNTTRIFITNGGQTELNNPVTIGKNSNAGSHIAFTENQIYRTGNGILYFQEYSTNHIIALNGGGNLLLGTSTNLGYKIFANGSAGGLSNWNNVSDGRLKKDITPVVNGLDKIKQLNGVYFNWDKEKRSDLSLDDNNHLGLIAQDVEEILPQVVSTSNDEFKTKTIAYSDIVPVLIEAIKELSAKVSLLENK